MKPVEVLEQAIGTGVLMHKRAAWNKPGVVIQKLPEERRGILQRLTSEELSKVRVEPWEVSDQNWEDSRKLSKSKLDFDRLIRGS
jgi:hypothetical protein